MSDPIREAIEKNPALADRIANVQAVARRCAAAREASLPKPVGAALPAGMGRGGATTAAVVAVALPPRKPRDPAELDRLTRETIFEAVAGRGQYREGALPVLLERPHGNESISTRPWDPVDYTLSMVRHTWASAERILSASDWASLRAVLEARVVELRDEGRGRTTSRRSNTERRPERRRHPDD